MSDIYLARAPWYYVSEKIRFNNDTTIYKATVWRYSGVYCEILFDEDNSPTDLLSLDTSHFELLDVNNNAYGIFDGYSTIYQLVDRGFILSNDGSVYVEPEVTVIDSSVESDSESIVEENTEEVIINEGITIVDPTE